MIESFYGTALMDDQIAKLPTHEHEVTPASLRHYLEQHADSLPRLIDFLRVMPTIMKAAAMPVTITGTPQFASRKGSILDYVKL